MEKEPKCYVLAFRDCKCVSSHEAKNNEKINKHSYQPYDGCSDPNERTDRNNNQGQFPASVEPYHEPREGCCHALNEKGHLVSDGFVDFINITRNKRKADQYNWIPSAQAFVETVHSLFPLRLCPLLLSNEK